MSTNLAIDDALLQQALKVGGHRTKKDTVTEALQEYIQRRLQLQLLELAGSIDYEEDFDYPRRPRSARIDPRTAPVPDRPRRPGVATPTTTSSFTRSTCR